MKTRKQGTTGLRKLLEDQLADMYYAEKQLVKTLPKMAKAATNKSLTKAFETHLKETEGQVARLEQVFAQMELPVKGKTCPAILGILQEGSELMEEFAGDEALDAALVAAAQKVEHYEIATYGSMCAWAEQLGLPKVAGLLNETLDEEHGADAKLTKLADEELNGEAVEAGEADDRKDGEQDARTSIVDTRQKPRSSNGKAGKPA
jgi:ferritin-like metal-binding protein YciE